MSGLSVGVVKFPGPWAAAGICGSNSDGRRLVKGGGVKVDGDPVRDEKATLSAGTYLLQSGKRKVARVTIP